MKIKGLLAFLVLVLVLVYFLWIAQAGRQDKVVEEIKELNEVKLKLTKANMTTLERSITSFIAGEGRTPNSLKELQTFYVQTTGMADAWGTTIKYVKISDISFRLISAGKDRVFNTQDDIVFEY